MTLADSDIGKAIHSMVAEGDVRKFDALASLHPNVLEAFRSHPEQNLVELAWQNRRDDVLMHLIVDHGFEFTTALKRRSGAAKSAADSTGSQRRPTFSLH